MAGKHKPPLPPSPLHPRNRHRGRYDFASLEAHCPELTAFVSLNAHGDPSIDFADPRAVKALNRAILSQVYGVAHWDIPEGYLCPPIPGRADCIHHLADLLGTAQAGVIPRGGRVRVLDIGVGANCVYPLIGHREYGWSFLGSDIDPGALACARAILQANPGLEGPIQLRLQPQPAWILKGLLQAGEVFDLTLCNPPFHPSLAAAREGTERKWRNLGRQAAPSDGSSGSSASGPVLNFGGQGSELWCPGGEAAFVGRLIQESVPLGRRCLWFSSLISREANLPGVYAALRAAGALERRTLPMAQGQKKSRIVAWTFQDEAARALWARNWRQPA